MAAAIATAVADGSFPNDEATLSSNLNSTLCSALLESIQHTKSELSGIVKDTSKHETGDVDGWIAQAKKVQQDIARCKVDARQIVQEHERIEALRQTKNETRSKVSLLEDEIAFNQALQQQINLISDTSSALNQVDADLRERHLVPASQTLPGLAASINAIPSHQSRSLLAQIHGDLSQSIKSQLKDELDRHCHVGVDNDTILLSMSRDNTQAAGDSSISVDEILDSLDRLGALQDTQRHLSRRIEACLLPHLHKRSKQTIVVADQDGSTLRLALSQEQAQPLQMLQVSKTLLQYMHKQAPGKLRDPLVHDAAALIVPKLVEHWLDTAIPTELEQLKELDSLQQQVDDFAQWLRNQSIKQANILDTWTKDVPKAWLGKRRTASLDAVRRAFKLASGVTRHVERTERQKVVVEPEHEQETTDDEWGENWDEDDDNPKETAKQPEDTAEDGSDAWGFDTDDQASEPQVVNTKGGQEVEEDDGDAWGWGDEGEATIKPPPAAEKEPAAAVNGTAISHAPKEEDMTLSEKYTITDIPDFILEQVGRDTLDLQTIRESPQAYFKASANPASELQSLPMLILAMFRAIAPNAYTDSTTFNPPLLTLNLYNDALYLAQKLEENTDLSKTLEPDIQTLTKFARQIYSSELSTQRQILNDLLDNAQGFIGCTRQPNASVCETAVSSTVDYLRSLHSQWSSILSPSHLSQSIGSLLNSVMSKMIKEIEDMEDISEPESQKLLSFMNQFSALESLFISPATRTDQVAEEEQRPDSTIAVYVASYFRFRYLEQILESSLVEIKYLWQEQGLSVEFSADEVVDLIKALFAESSHRRNAIHTIRSGG